MLSVLIPVYNYNCFDLVNELNQQALDQEMPYEIIVMDDCSTQPAAENKEINKLENCTLIELPENVGRAKIRNLLADKAQYDNLLFLDCDACPNTNFYIQRYTSFCKEENIVVCGGRVYESVPPPEPELYLHWLYGKKREVIPVVERQKAPYHSFMSNNFMISKTLFNKIRFNEKITTYGHEDSLFGIELKKQKAKIYHIENPLIHIGLESAERILEKERESIENLIYISKEIIDKSTLAEEVKLLSFGLKLQKWHLAKTAAKVFSICENSMTKNITSDSPSLFMLDCYKLTYLCRCL